MSKNIIVDFDLGLKSVGSDEYIKKIFGFMPRRFIDSDSLFQFFNYFFKKKIIVLKDTLGNVKQEVYELQGDIDADFVILDSMTAYQAQNKKDLKGSNLNMTLPLWGQLAEKTEELVNMLSRINTNCIVIGHTKAQEDQELGIIKQVPALSGRMQNEIARYFDIVAYTYVETDPKTGNRNYYWIMSADERHDAKCRLDSVNEYLKKNKGIMPQDFGLLWDLINKNYANEPIKMLILGNPGTGKTYSLRSLQNVKIENKSKKQKKKEKISPVLEAAKEAGGEVEEIIQNDEENIVHPETLKNLQGATRDNLMLHCKNNIKEAKDLMFKLTGKKESSELTVENCNKINKYIEEETKKDKQNKPPEAKPDLEEF